MIDTSLRSLAAAMLASVLAAIVATVVYSAAAKLADPNRLGSRLIRLEADPYPPSFQDRRVIKLDRYGASCRGHDGIDEGGLRKAVSTAAGVSGMTLRVLDLIAKPDADNPNLHLFALNFRGDGQYSSVLAGLDQVARLEPKVFAVAIDLTVKGSVVSVDFQGQVACFVDRS